jgi:hypothetical protein
MTGIARLDMLWVGLIGINAPMQFAQDHWIGLMVLGAGLLLALGIVIFDTNRNLPKNNVPL